MAQTASAAVAERAPRTIIKEVEHAILYSDNTITVKKVRVSYPHFDVPYAGKNDDGKEGKAKYGGVFLMPKQPIYFPAKDIIKGEIDKLVAAAKLPGMQAANKFLRDGNLRPDKPVWVGNFTISANEVRRPALRGRGVDPRTGRARIVEPKEAAELFYGGCWVNILIRPWYQNNSWGKKVNANLLAVQFVADDEPFGEGRISDDEIDDSFGVIDDDDSGYDDGAGLGDELDL